MVNRTKSIGPLALSTIHYLLSPFTRSSLPFLFLLGRGPSLEAFELLSNVAVSHIDAVDFCERRDCSVKVAHRFISRTEFVLERLIFLGTASGSIKALLKPKHRRTRHALLNETMTQHVTALKVA